MTAPQRKHNHFEFSSFKGVNNFEPFHFAVMSRIKLNEINYTKCSMCSYYDSIGQTLYFYFRRNIMVICSDHSWCRDTETHKNNSASVSGRLDVPQLMHSFFSLVKNHL